MKGKLNALVLGGLVALAPVTAFANAVFDQLFVSDGANGIASDSGNGFSQYEVADNFTLGTASILTGLVFAGNHFDPQNSADNFIVNIYADDPSFPGAPSIAPLWSQTVGDIAETALGVSDVDGNPLFRYEIAVAGPALLAGQQYWLSIVNELGQQGDDWFWSFSEDGADGFNAGRSLLGGLVDFDVFADGDLAFPLLGEPVRDVPEPGSIALLGAGLALAGFARRKRA